MPEFDTGGLEKLALNAPGNQIVLAPAAVTGYDFDRDVIRSDSDFAQQCNNVIAILGNLSRISCVSEDVVALSMDIAACRRGIELQDRACNSNDTTNA